MIDRYRIETGTIYEYENGSYICIGRTAAYTESELNKMRSAKCNEDNLIYRDAE